MTERAIGRAGNVAWASLLRTYGLWILATVVVFALPHIFDSRANQSMFGQMGIFVIFALSYNMLLGQSGMLSFGHAVYFGFAGFVSVHVMRLVDAGFAYPAILLPFFGAAAGLALGIIFGSFSTKRAGTVFAMITLGIAELVGALATFIGFFGGEEGITGDRTIGPGLPGFSLAPQIQVYYVIAAWALIAALLMYAITRTPLGRMANAVRDNPERAAFIGYNTQRVRFVMFSLSGMFAGVAGALFAIQFEILQFTNIGVAASGSVLLMTFIGGAGFFLGPIIGAILVTFLELELTNFTNAWLLYFGLFFVLMVMFIPTGVAGLIMQHQPIWRAGVLHRLAPAYALALVPGLVFAVGTIGLIEIVYFTSTKAGTNTIMSVFTITFDAAKPLPWITAAVVAIGGFALFRLTFTPVKQAWEEVNLQAMSKLSE